MSASRIPTVAPVLRRAPARRAVVDDLPTPPFPLPMATTCWIRPLSIRASTPAPGRRAGPLPGGDVGRGPAGASFPAMRHCDEAHAI